MTKIRTIPCGCCISGCICASHSGAKHGFKAVVCEHHALLDKLQEQMRQQLTKEGSDDTRAP